MKKSKRAIRSPRRNQRWNGWRDVWPATLLSISLTGCASEQLLDWPAAPSGTGPNLTGSPAELIRLPVAQAKPTGEIRAALPPALVSSLTRGPAKPAIGAAAPPPAIASDAKKDDQVGTVTSADPSIRVVPTPPVVPPAAVEYPLDLTTALRLAEVENPEIAETRQRIREALGVLQGARVLAVPTLNAGLNYHGHTGNLQRSSGRILNLSEQSLYVGGGARTLAAESLAFPAVNIVSPLADVLFEPLVARQDVTRTQFAYRATANQILLEVAVRYFDLIWAESSLELRRETEAEANEIVRMTTVYADTGQGRKADADRAATTALLIHREVQRGEEEVSVASTWLANRLHLDPSVRMRPIVARIEPINLIDLHTPVEELVRVALQQRPEMGARAALVGVASTRYRQERYRPLLPILWLGFSGGGFGGGSNLITPLFGDFGGRTDFDVRAFWTLQNMGFGNMSLWRQRRAQVGVALGEQSRTINLIRREVGAARAQAINYRGQIDVTERQLATAEAGFREDLDRIRGTIGLPIEVTNSLDLLYTARQRHLRAIIDYDLAQFRLFVALGSPPPLDRPPTDPLPPAPVAYPPLPLPNVSGLLPTDGAPTGPSEVEPAPAIAATPAPAPVAGPGTGTVTR